MKKYLYSLFIVLLPAIARSQNRAGSSTANIAPCVMATTAHADVLARATCNAAG
ncbi:hypothetical protein MKQ70_12695 [Chitinophaga sedimenti]|uniref:hypothetical protein n=1 Tax=Chitinophaga sedimenti TaxID=2033606 RepID=UPI002005E30C|nr:hypothetical protein [Chitinophaga sedimenti]MCK7555829.1 hypothetical protein [Chitinophaga sedimenti]